MRLSWQTDEIPGLPDERRYRCEFSYEIAYEGLPLIGQYQPPGE
jgi:hypothetical protein